MELAEEWRPIKGFPGYEVSNFGRVKSLARDYKYGKHEDMFLKFSDRRGYLKATLFKNGKRYYKAVHRLVAEAFIPNPNNLPCVNHKDESRTNNTVNNLEWCDHLYNSNYGTAKEKISNRVSRKVAQYTRSGVFICEYDSMTKASLETGTHISEISKCCKDNHYSANGFKWRKVI